MSTFKKNFETTIREQCGAVADQIKQYSVKKINKQIYFHEVETYPDVELTSSEHAQFYVNVNEEQFKEICSTFSAWQKIRRMLLKNRKKI